MYHNPTRSPFPARRSSSSGVGTDANVERGGRGGAGGRGGVRDGTAPLFRRINNNVSQQQAGDRNGGPQGGVGVDPAGSLQAMRQFVADASIASSAAGRPRTTGSVRQSAAAEVRRQSMGSIHSASLHHRQQQQQQQLVSPMGSYGQNQQHQHQHARLTRNMTLGDLRSTSTGGGAGGGPHGMTVGERENGGEGVTGVVVRRGWQTGGSSRGGQEGSRPAGGGLGDRGGRPCIPDGGPLGGGGLLSRLPLLDSSGEQGMPGSVENALLSGTGMSFGVSALKGRRPYMEDEYKVRERASCHDRV